MKITAHSSGRSRFEEDGNGTISLQHLNVKLWLKDQENLDLDPAISVFHSWIQQQQPGDDLLLDVADYRHMYGGPGIILIGHEADYSIDNADNRWGVRYNRKTSVEGDNQQKLGQAVRASLLAFERLQKDTRLKGKLNFNGTDVEITVNDRLLAPNREATRAALAPDFEAFSEVLFGGSEHSLLANEDSRRLLTIALKSARAFTVGELLENLSRASVPKHRPKDVDAGYARERNGNNTGFAAEAPARGEFAG